MRPTRMFVNFCERSQIQFTLSNPETLPSSRPQDQFEPPLTLATFDIVPTSSTSSSSTHSCSVVQPPILETASSISVVSRTDTDKALEPGSIGRHFWESASISCLTKCRGRDEKFAAPFWVLPMPENLLAECLFKCAPTSCPDIPSPRLRAYSAYM